MERDEIITQLSDDLDSTYGAPNIVKVSDTTLYRAQMTYDETSFENVRDWGDVWGDTAYYNDRAEYPQRPEGFDGNAEVLRVNQHGDRVWWQPPSDVPRSHPGFSELRDQVEQLLEYGFQVIIVERCEGTDAYGRPIVVAVESLGGIEPYADDSYLRGIVGECYDEVSP